MATQHTVVNFTAQDKTLSIIAHDLGGSGQPSISDAVEAILREISPFLKHQHHAAYIRDLQDSTIEGKYPNGHTPNPYEIFIAVTKWPVDDEASLVDAFAHAMHHLLRWQNGGYGEMLGRALVTEGMACWFAELQSGRKAPWIKKEITPEIWNEVRKHWDDELYNHPEWFLDGPLGKWVGYRAGYRLVQQALGGKFDLRQSVMIDEDTAKRSIPGT